MTDRVILIRKEMTSLTRKNLPQRVDLDLVRALFQARCEVWVDVDSILDSKMTV